MIDSMLLFLNLLCHLSVFCGAFYVVLHNKSLPLWHVTPLWYVGLSCFANALSILMQYAFGTEFPLSYTNVGLMTETSLNVSLSAIALIVLFGTTKKTRLNRAKKRS
jgi:hypothetical protein